MNNTEQENIKKEVWIKGLGYDPVERVKELLGDIKDIVGNDKQAAKYATNGLERVSKEFKNELRDNE